MGNANIKGSVLQITNSLLKHKPTLHVEDQIPPHHQESDSCALLSLQEEGQTTLFDTTTQTLFMATTPFLILIFSFFEPHDIPLSTLLRPGQSPSINNNRTYLSWQQHSFFFFYPSLGRGFPSPQDKHCNNPLQVDLCAPVAGARILSSSIVSLGSPS